MDENDDDDDNDDQDDDDDEQNDDRQSRRRRRRGGRANELDERQARLRMKRFSSSALCLNDNSEEPEGGANLAPTAPSGAGQKIPLAKKKLLALETGSGTKTLGSKLKSKLNNNNNCDALERLAAAPASDATNRRDKRSPSSVSSTSAGGLCSSSTTTSTTTTKSPGGLLCPPEAADPIVQLARQRRPSVSNQGSVNVDQQGEFMHCF